MAKLGHYDSSHNEMAFRKESWSTLNVISELRQARARSCSSRTTTFAGTLIIQLIISSDARELMR